MSKDVVLYQSVNRGFSNPDGRERVVYLGKVFRVPRSQQGSIQQLEWEPSPRDLLLDAELSDGTPVCRDPQGVIERLEIFDRDSGDLWVMYRVPCRATEKD